MVRYDCWFNKHGLILFVCLFIIIRKTEICDIFKKNIYRVLKVVKLGVRWRFLEGVWCLTWFILVDFWDLYHLARVNCVHLLPTPVMTLVDWNSHIGNIYTVDKEKHCMTLTTQSTSLWEVMSHLYPRNSIHRGWLSFDMKAMPFWKMIFISYSTQEIMLVHVGSQGKASGFGQVAKAGKKGEILFCSLIGISLTFMGKKKKGSTSSLWRKGRPLFWQVDFRNTL